MWINILIKLMIWTPVLSLDNMTVDLLTPIAEYGEACGYQACPAIQPNYLNVHIVPATHAELAGTRTFYQFYEGDDNLPFETEHGINVKNIFDSVITSLWSAPKRRFTLSDLPYFFHWWKNRDATVHRMVYELIRQGRLYFVGGGWGMSDEASAHYHAIIDHYTYGLRKLNATFLECARPLVTWQADTFGHSREFASLMAQMGFDGHFISPISYDDELARMRSKSLEFVWRGSDDLGADTDIFTHKLFDGYWSPPGFCFGFDCTDPLIVTSDFQFSNVVERIQEFGKLMQVRQGPYYTTNNVMVIMGQRMGYFDSNVWFANIDKLIIKVNEAKPKAGLRLRLVYSTPACYLKEVQKAQPTLRTKQDDFFPMAYDKDTHFTGMFYSRPILKYHAQEIHLLMVITKQLQMFGHLKNNDKFFEDIQWIAGAMLDHTILTGGLQQYVARYYTIKVHKAKMLCMKIIKSALNKLRIAPSNTTYYLCPFNVTSCWTISSHMSYIVIYNPLAWPVTRPVRLPVQRLRYNLYDNKGEKVNHSIISIPEIVKHIPERTQASHSPAMDDELVFIAEDLPAMGFRSYYLEIESARQKREIVKKMAKKKKRKFLTRQNNVKTSDHNLINDYDDEYLEDLTHRPPFIEFANVSTHKQDPRNYDYIMTPRNKTNDSRRASEASDKDDDSYDEYPSRDTSPYLLPSRRVHLRRTTAEPFSPQRTHWPTNSSTTNDSSQAIEASDKENDSYEEYTSRDTSPYLLPSRREHLRRTTSEPFSPQRTHWPTSTSATKQFTDDTVPTTMPTTSPNTTTTIKTSTGAPAPEYYDDERSHNTTDDEESEGEVTWEEELVFRRLERTGYFSVQSPDDFIKNEHIKISLNQNSGKITSIALSNGVYMNFDINMMYYVSDDPNQMGTTKKSPGPFVFRPMDPNPESTSNNPILKVIKSEFVQEAQIQFSPYTAAALRLYKSMPYVEVDWVVGPIPIQDGFGKDMFIRYSTDLENNGVFYTDSNGRQTIKRIKNMRSTYTPVNTDVSSNFYPITSKVYIEDTDKNIRFSVFPDRSEGCTSLNQGEIDLMLHRRILTGDTLVNGPVNETLFGIGLIVRGNHRLYLSKADYKPNKFFEKKFAKELELHPQVFTSSHPIFEPSISLTNWSSCRNEYSALKKKLPIGVHILSFEKWNHQVLIRLENYLELNDVVKNGIKTVNILGLFKNYVITSCKETMLGTNIWKSDYVKMQWQKDKFVKNFNDVFGNSSNLQFAEDVLRHYETVDLIVGIELIPQQIRTFVCNYELPSVLS